MCVHPSEGRRWVASPRSTSTLAAIGGIQFPELVGRGLPTAPGPVVARCGLDAAELDHGSDTLAVDRRRHRPERAPQQRRCPVELTGAGGLLSCAPQHAHGPIGRSGFVQQARCDGRSRFAPLVELPGGGNGPARRHGPEIYRRWASRRMPRPPRLGASPRPGVRVRPPGTTRQPRPLRRSRIPPRC